MLMNGAPCVIDVELAETLKTSKSFGREREPGQSRSQAPHTGHYGSLTIFLLFLAILLISDNE